MVLKFRCLNYELRNQAYVEIHIYGCSRAGIVIEPFSYATENVVQTHITHGAITMSAANSTLLHSHKRFF